MKSLIKKILKESNEEKFIRYVASRVNPPYFKNLEYFGVKVNEIRPILTLIFKQPIKIKDKQIFNEKNEDIYYENSNGDWEKYKYDENGNLIYSEDSDGFWRKFEYDEIGNEIYYEDSNGNWEKSEYDENGYQIYSEDSNGFWRKSEYDESGNLIYYENSNKGIIIDKR